MELISHTEYLEKTDNSQNEPSIFFGGKELNVAKGFVFGPYTHDFYDIHYCQRGAIDLFVNNNLIKITDGMLFVIPPYTKVEKVFTEDSSTLYITIRNTPNIERFFAPLGLSKDSIVFPYEIPEHCAEYLDKIIDSLTSHSLLFLSRPDEDLLPDIITAPRHNAAERRMRKRGLFYLLISELMGICGAQDSESRTESAREYYINKAIKYIENNYNFDINVDTVAKHVGLNRSYLYSLFRDELGISIRDFIIRTRIKAACDLLQHDDIPIKTVAASIKYEPVAFAHIFKKVMGMSAAEYRRRYKKT